jgi:colanic acid/amylovoran biosynthesis glycosyltransferase
MVEVKGHEFTLLAFQKLVLFLATIGSKATLKFVGGGPLIDSLRKKSEELGLTDRVQFLDSVSHSQVKGFLLESDYFLHPSITTSDGRIEGLPNAIMEALAVGVPVIATQHSGIEELMCPQGALFLVEEKNVSEYSKVMIQLVMGELQFDSEKSRKMIEKKFSTHQHISQLLAFYHIELSQNSAEKNFG